jgi:rubrerythrin
MSTEKNLNEAFAGESQANRKYLAFAKKADQDGYPQVARLFRAAAAAETVHAHAHLRALGEIKSTRENLNSAIAGEGFEFQNMYPSFLEEAQEEGHKQAERSFEYALAVEKIHYDLYKSAKEAVEGEKDLEERKIFVCQVCGNTVYDGAPEKCPICNAPKSSFTKID